jgi:AcrR family transcriptional regulator
MVNMKPVVTSNGARERILATATILFAKSGYRGVSTRDIASAAHVNEVTLFRHYPKKHDLYLAVIRTGLQQVHIRGDLLARIAEACDGRSALSRTFELVESALTQKPELLRLMQYGALEMKEDFVPLVRSSLGEFIEIIAGYLEPWVKKGELRCANSKVAIFAVIAIAANHASIHELFLGDELDSQAQFETFASICCP